MTRGRRLLTFAVVVTLTGCTTTSEGLHDLPVPDVAATASASAASPLPVVVEPLLLADGTTVGIDGDPPEAVGDVGYGGTITTVEGGCWGFDDGSETSVFFLVEGAAQSEDGTGVVTNNGVELHVGDRVYGGGYAVRPGSEVDRLWRAARPACFEGRNPGVYSSLRVVAPGVG